MTGVVSRRRERRLGMLRFRAYQIGLIHWASIKSPPTESQKRPEAWLPGNRSTREVNEGVLRPGPVPTYVDRGGWVLEM